MKSWAYTVDHIPFIANVSSYRSNWIKWWTSCQPAWRQDSGWPLPRDSVGTTNWAKACAQGQNGLFLIIMLTTWWVASITSEQDWAEFNEAVDDIHWVIDQILDSLQTLPVRVAKPNLLFCIHQWDSEGICRCEWECRGLGWS